MQPEKWKKKLKRKEKENTSTPVLKNISRFSSATVTASGSSPHDPDTDKPNKQQHQGRLTLDGS